MPSTVLRKPSTQVGGAIGKRCRLAGQHRTGVPCSIASSGVRDAQQEADHARRHLFPIAPPTWVDGFLRTVDGMRSECWTGSDQNTGRHQLRTPGRLRRNPHARRPKNEISASIPISSVSATEWTRSRLRFELSIAGREGDLVEYRPTVHATADGSVPPDPLVRIVRPSVVRERLGGLPDVVVRATVVSVP